MIGFIVNENYVSALGPKFALAFDSMLEHSSKNSKNWEMLQERLKIHGLLSFSSQSPHKPKEIELDPERLDDPRYRRQLVRKLKARRPGKFQYHTFAIDRTRIATENDYRETVATFLGGRFVASFFPLSSGAASLVVWNHTDLAIGVGLGLGPHQISGDVVAAKILRHWAERFVEQNETYRRVELEIRAAARDVRVKLMAESAAISNEHLAAHRASLDAITGDANRRFDEVLATALAGINATADRCQAVLDASPKGDQETLWRAELARRDEERKAKSFLRKLKIRFFG